MKRSMEAGQSGIEMDGALWNDPLTRRKFLKSTGVSSAAVVVGGQALRASETGGGQTSSGSLIKVTAVSPPWQPYNSAIGNLNQWGLVGLAVFSGPTERLHVIVRDMSGNPYQTSVLLGAARDEWKAEVHVEGRREKLESQDGYLQWVAKEKHTLKLRHVVRLNAAGDIVGVDDGSVYQANAGKLFVAARQNWNAATNTMNVQGTAFWEPTGELTGAGFSIGPLSTEFKFKGGATYMLGPVTVTYTFAKV